MEQWFSEHRVLACVLAVVLGVLTSAVWRALTGSGIPVEVRREWAMSAAAAGVRRVGMGWRAVWRYGMVLRATDPYHPVAKAQLADARRAAADAVWYLARAIRRGVKLGVPPATLLGLEAWLREARRLQALVANTPTVREFAVRFAQPPADPVDPLAELARALDDAVQVMAAWRADIARGEAALAHLDPVVVRSGGMLRRPFASDRTGELDATRTVLALREAQDDYRAVSACLQEIVGLLPDGARPAAPLSAALDRLARATGQPAAMLPVALVTGESPAAAPADVPPGVLQRLFFALGHLEAGALRRW